MPVGAWGSAELASGQFSMMDKESLFNSIEKAFRYLVPGFIFLVLARAACPSLVKQLLSVSDFGKIEYAIAVPSIGMVTYAVHRLLYWVTFEYLLFRCFKVPATRLYSNFYPDALADFFVARQETIKDPLSGYLYYRFAVLHQCLMLAEMFLVFSLVQEVSSHFAKAQPWIAYAAGALWILSFIHFVQMLLAEKTLLKKASNSLTDRFTGRDQPCC